MHVARADTAAPWMPLALAELRGQYVRLCFLRIQINYGLCHAVSVFFFLRQAIFQKPGVNHISIHPS